MPPRAGFDDEDLIEAYQMIYATLDCVCGGKDMDLLCLPPIPIALSAYPNANVILFG
jgi:hypothetical protein